MFSKSSKTITLKKIILDILNLKDKVKDLILISNFVSLLKKIEKKLILSKWNEKYKQLKFILPF